VLRLQSFAPLEVTSLALHTTQVGQHIVSQSWQVVSKHQPAPCCLRHWKQPALPDTHQHCRPELSGRQLTL
jgi:hypothetical protein